MTRLDGRSVDGEIRRRNSRGESFDFYLEHWRSLTRPWGIPRVIDALRNISLIVKRGETTALIGRNGAGKSTLLRAMTGFEPSSGKITTLGRVVILAGTDPDSSLQ